jgi:hypothetical protein
VAVYLKPCQRGQLDEPLARKAAGLCRAGRFTTRRLSWPGLKRDGAEGPSPGFRRSHGRGGLHGEAVQP